MDVAPTGSAPPGSVPSGPAPHVLAPHDLAPHGLAADEVARAHGRGWLLLRAGLLVVALLLGGWALAQRTSPASLSDLYADVAAGRVDVVQVEPGFDPGFVSELGSGWVVQEVRWRTGQRRWQADLVVVSGDEPVEPGVAGERTTDDVVAEVRRRDPSVRVDATTPPGTVVEVFGARLSGLPALPAALAALACLGLLVAGPQPWRATRWAWFWLASVPGAAVAFLVLSGPAPLLPRPAPSARRLTGGRAFVLSLLLGAVAAWAGRLLW